MSDETIEPAADVATTHTTGRMSGRIEIVGRVSGRRQTAFAEVRISEPPVMLSALPAEVSADAWTAGQIGIELPSGVRLTVDGAVDAEALSRVIGVLAR